MFINNWGAYIEFQAVISAKRETRIEKVLVKKKTLFKKAEYKEKQIHYVKFGFIDMMGDSRNFTWECSSLEQSYQVYDEMCRQIIEQKESVVDKAFESALLGDKS